MLKTDDIFWFKNQFFKQIETAIKGSPFNLDMITAIACQETGYIWQTLRKKSLGLDKILELCVGDTIDVDGGRRAFPKTKDDLLAKPDGTQMFHIARQALVDMAHYVSGYKKVAANPNKFCHGFGIFQYDLQFFLKDPGYFLQKRYADFNLSLQKCIEELHHAMKRIHWENKKNLSDYEMACVAIAYNTGGFKASKGLKQGFFDGNKYYGESVFDFLRLSKTVILSENGLSSFPSSHPGETILPPPTPVEAKGIVYEVDVRETPLRLRKEPLIDKQNPSGNVIAWLPDGHIVRAVSNIKTNGFLEVETSLRGAYYRGFAHADYLKPDTNFSSVPMEMPSPEPPNRGIIPVHMPRKSGTITRRIDTASAHSLNEPNQPGRKGATPDELRTELGAIIEWLSVDKETHLRYRPHNKMTFCNIYAHDFCHLAGVYLPRVWWTPGAIESLALGNEIKPMYGSTIDEQRANDLFRWLRDFGLRFGWRQTGSLSKLQLEVNQGAIGLIVARRKNDGLSGHIVLVVPETDNFRARRNTSGDVCAPLQSQAGSTNFRYGTGKTDWWKSDQFAESAFWLHP